MISRLHQSCDRWGKWTTHIGGGGGCGSGGGEGERGLQKGWRRRFMYTCRQYGPSFPAVGTLINRFRELRRHDPGSKRWRQEHSSSQDGLVTKVNSPDEVACVFPLSLSTPSTNTQTILRILTFSNRESHSRITHSTQSVISISNTLEMSNPPSTPRYRPQKAISGALRR
jgi:hypothetical protein